MIAPYTWPDKTLYDILARQEYLGHTITAVSYTHLRLLGFDTVFKIDDKPDFLIFPQRFCFGNIHALDTLLYRFFRIGPVSYTHLDVYKRQGQDDALRGLARD